MNRRKLSGKGEKWFPRLVPQTQGDIAEFGVYEGGNTVLLAEYGRTVWAFDTYDGIPEEGWDAALDYKATPGRFKPRMDVDDMFVGYSNIVPVVGDFHDSLLLLGVHTSDIADKIKFGFVFIDSDTYVSHKTVLEWLPDHLEHRAIVMFDDYQCCAGARKAIDEFTKTHGLVLEDDIYVRWK